MKQFTMIIIKDGKVYSSTRKATNDALTTYGMMDMAKDSAEFIMKEIVETEEYDKAMEDIT